MTKHIMVMSPDYRLSFINVLLHNTMVLWAVEVTRILLSVFWGLMVFALVGIALWDLKEYLRMVVDIY